MIPFAPLQVPIALGVTYAVGKAAQASIKDGMPSSKEKYLEIFNSAKQTAKSLTTELANHPLREKPLDDEKRDFSQRA
jgi:hypothetical protein